MISINPQSEPAPASDALRAQALFHVSEPQVDRVAYDFGAISIPFLARLAGAPIETGTPIAAVGPTLLPSGYQWSDPTTGKRRIPVMLCEYLAYKAALVYESKDVILANLGDATDFRFFDSTRSTHVANSQGCGFVFDGMIVIVMRGTESGKPGTADWMINLDDALTDERLLSDASQAVRLTKRHGKGVSAILQRAHDNKRYGQHLGFTVGWGAVHDEIVSWLADRSPQGMPIVIAGHSLGGALAQIGASELARLGYPVAAVVTFGAPLVGNKTFCDAYVNLGLDEKTVRFESDGDSVPRVMRRWYYRLDRNTRAALERWFIDTERTFTEAQRARTDHQFSMVGQSLIFNEAPPLSSGEVTAAIAAILNARKEQAQGGNHAASKSTDAQPASQPATRTGEPVRPGPHRPEAAAASPNGSQGNHGLYIVAVILLLVAVLLLWLFFRSKLASHAISERYALFLSTLSYQKIRSLHADRSEPLAVRLSAANEDLSRYLTFIRGEGVRRGTYYKDRKLDMLPVRLSPDWDLETFRSNPQNIA